MSDDSELTDYYPRQRKWLRALFMLVVLVGYGFAEALLWFLTLVQFFWVLFRGEPNQYIQQFANKLVKWTSSAILFCLWKTNMPPFPFSPWPDDN